MIAGGFAADGFPFNLRYGYRDPNNLQSGLVVVQGSWMLRPGTRPSALRRHVPRGLGIRERLRRP